MKRKPAQKKPKVSPQSAAASLLAQARWAKRTPAERTREMRRLAQRPRSQDRCDCGVMTRKRAEARGRTWEHERGCSFHPEIAVTVSADEMRTNGDRSVAETPQIWREKPR